MAVKINKGNMPGINMTPMIDCVFLLMIFFLVATRMEEEDQRMLDVKLPVASEAVPITVRPKTVYVVVDKEGRYFVGDRQVTAEQLLGVLQQAAAANPGRQTVEIRADRRVQWEFVVKVINQCLRANIREYRTVTADPGA